MAHCEDCGTRRGFPLEHEIKRLERERNEARKWINYVRLAVIDPLKTQFGDELSDGKAVEIIIDRLQAAESRLRELEEQTAPLIKFLERVVECEQDERYKSVWTLYHIHGGRYEGPFYKDEKDAALLALAALRKGEPAGKDGR